MPDRSAPSPIALVASDEEWIARSLDSILGQAGYRVVRTRGAVETLDTAQRVEPDVFLIDAKLPDTGGVALAARLRSELAGRTGSPILITAQDPASRETRLESLRAGAWDYVVFPWDAEELLLRLELYLQAKAAADVLRADSLVDPETGSYSPQGILRRLREVGAIATRNARPLACVTLAPDAERGAPQELVHRLSQVLEAQTRDSDSVGRIGQHEFVVLAPETDARGALRLAERLAGSAEALLAAHGVGGRRIRAGCFGVHNARDAALEPVEIMTRATLALRQSQAEPDASAIRLYGAGPLA